MLWTVHLCLQVQSALSFQGQVKDFTLFWFLEHICSRYTRVSNLRVRVPLHHATRTGFVTILNAPCSVITRALRVVLGVAPHGRQAVKGASRVHRPNLQHLLRTAGQHSAMLVPSHKTHTVVVGSQHMNQQMHTENVFETLTDHSARSGWRILIHQRCSRFWWFCHENNWLAWWGWWGWMQRHSLVPWTIRNTWVHTKIRRNSRFQ